MFQLIEKSLSDHTALDSGLQLAKVNYVIAPSPLLVKNHGETITLPILLALCTHKSTICTRQEATIISHD
jgi:hypothetical protein